MRIAIASGKGGAGKTTVTSSLAAVWDRSCVLVDADVEAPNLHLFLTPDITRTIPVNLEVPILDRDRCTVCGICRDFCRFKAIARLGKKISVFADMCHGCGGCLDLCPEKALSPGARELGELLSGTALGGRHAFLMGRARIGESMTPPQLRALLAELEAILGKPDAPYREALIDVPPGVSCPAMTACGNADLILLVAEPTPFGFHDFKLAHSAFGSTGKMLSVVINRTGMPGNRQGDDELRFYCHERGLPVLAELPFSHEAARAYASGRVPGLISENWSARFVELREAIRKVGKSRAVA